MKKSLSILTAFVAMIPVIARAGGEYHDSGCGSEPLPKGCEQVFFGGIAVMLGLFVLAAIFDRYKMKTDPAYRARSEQYRREYDARHRR